jgi:hypothetical protein
MDNKDYNTNIDHMFANHFRGNKAPVTDKDLLWKNIQSKRRRKTGVFWSLAGIVLLAGSTFAWLHIQQAEFFNPETSSGASSGVAYVDKVYGNPKNHDEMESRMGDYTMVQSRNSRDKDLPKNNSNLHTKVKKIEPYLSERMEEESPLNLTLNEKEDSQELPVVMKSEPESFEELFAIPLRQLKVQRNEESLPEHMGAGPDWDKCWVRPRGQWFLDAYAQIGRPLEDIQFSGESSGYASEWEEQYDPAFAYHGGLMIGRQFHWNGYLAAGLEYQQFQTEHLNELRIVETIQIFDPRAYYTVDENGVRQYVGDTVTVTNVRDEIERSANNYKMLHLPIHLGYRSKGKYWRYGIDVSALINLSFNYEGVFLKSDGMVVEVDDNNQSDYFADGIGTSFSAALHLGRMIGDRTELYMQPRFRFNGQNYHNEETGLSIKRNFAGIRLGLRYYLE